MAMRGKTVMAAILILTFLISIVVGVLTVKAESKTITVPDDYPTIQAALNNAVDGDTIFVKKGVYVENPIVNKSVSLGRQGCSGN
jgi:pectin methylesterase-like acyl-CoA thioesterase